MNLINTSFGRIKKYWKDPVWSNVIAVLILAIVTTITKLLGFLPEYVSSNPFIFICLILVFFCIYLMYNIYRTKNKLKETIIQLEYANNSRSCQRFYQTQKINIGDYFIFDSGFGNIKVTVKDLKKAVVKNRFYEFDGTSRECEVALLSVDVNGLSMYGGISTNRVSRYDYWVPQTDNIADISSTLHLYHYNEYSFESMTIGVQHINSHAKIIEVGCLIIRIDNF